MLDRVTEGEVAKKHHVALRAADGSFRHEECLTREGFDGPYSILYHLNRPHALTQTRTESRAVPASSARSGLRRRHYRTARMGASGTDAVALLTSPSIAITVGRPSGEDAVYRVRADADELWFVRKGSGVLRSAFGDLEFGALDYVCVPKGVLHRFLWREPTEVLRIECSDLGIPRQFRNAVGQLRMDAPYSHRDFRRPRFTGPLDERIRLVHVEERAVRHVFTAHASPLDVVGWDGTVYPWAFPILAFQPRVGSVHLPPTWHGTFAADGALVCSFVPRLLDFGRDAIPCPYPHASVDIDEVLYYVSGEFGSRSGIEAGSISLHPRGVPHGPHPGRYEASIGATRTDEVAVMLDCRDRLAATIAADAIEDLDYEASFAAS
jgi:homogentisate 1,2-dioxygenase